VKKEKVKQENKGGERVSKERRRGRTCPITVVSLILPSAHLAVLLDARIRPRETIDTTSKENLRKMKMKMKRKRKRKRNMKRMRMRKRRIKQKRSQEEEGGGEPNGVGTAASRSRRTIRERSSENPSSITIKQGDKNIREEKRMSTKGRGGKERR